MHVNPLVTAIVEWLTEKKGDHIDVYHIEQSSGYTDYAIICEGSADQHVRAIANHILDNVKEHGLPLLSKEGIEFAHWALIDLGEVIVHIFMPQTRQFYKIDELFHKLAKPGSGKETPSLVESNDTETITEKESHND